MKLIKRYGIDRPQGGDSAATLAELQRRRDRLAPLIERAADAPQSAPGADPCGGARRVGLSQRCGGGAKPQGAVGLMQLMPA